MLLIFIGFLIVVAVTVIFLSTRGSLFGKKAEATFGETKVSLDVVDTPETREKGLSGRNSLADDKGMLFIFDEPTIPSFWMKGMKFPIDIIFLNDNKIVTIHKNVPQPKTTTELPTAYYQPDSLVNRTIELKAGMADKYNLKVGDTVDIAL